MTAILGAPRRPRRWTQQRNTNFRPLPNAVYATPSSVAFDSSRTMQSATAARQWFHFSSFKCERCERDFVLVIHWPLDHYSRKWCGPSRRHILSGIETDMLGIHSNNRIIFSHVSQRQNPATQPERWVLIFFKTTCRRVD